MGNIIGESFSPYVASQVNVRQQKLGQFSKDPDTLLFTTANAPYIRLTSGVDIEPEKCLEIGLDSVFAGNNLAKQYIMLGGTAYKKSNSPREAGEPRNVNKAESTGLRSGLATSYTDLFGAQAYGLTSNSDYGLVPMPGITGISVKAKNRGSLRECEINLTCHNKFQFYIIETLFLRLKYPFLLEYGHSVYFDNSGTLITTPPSNSDYFLLPDNTQREVLDQIESTREASSGNYDAFLGYVTNFSWNIRPDGGYDITIKGTTPGDVIESLKINVLKTDDPDAASEETEDEAPSIEKDKNKTTLNQIFFAIKEIMEGEDGWFTEKSYVILDKLGFSSLYNEISTLPPITGNLKEKYNNFTGAAGAGAFTNPSSNLNGSRECVRFEFSFDNEDTGEEQYYMKFGTLLRMIECFCLVYDTSKNKKPPLISISQEAEDNYCFTIPQQFSADPRICLIPVSTDYKNALNEAASWWMRNPKEDLNKFNNALGLSFRTSSPYIGKMMNIHINLNYISRTLSENLDENGDLSLYDFLSSLLQGVQKALGGINNFEVIYNEDTNEIKFMDNTQIPGIEKFVGSPDKFTPTLINANILKPNFGSFVTNVGIKSEITNKIASMMTIGAQANGNVVGENATAFSHWNTGLLDRIVPEKQNSEEEKETNIKADTGQSAKEKFENYQKKVAEFLVTIVRLSTDEDDISTYSTNIKPYYDYIVGDLSQPKPGKPAAIPPLGFIPLSLDIDMLGLSGIKIYQKYKINEELLPPNYEDRIEFITKGVNHKVDSSGWITSIDGQTVPKNSTTEKAKPGFFNRITGGPNTPQPKPRNPGSPASGNRPNPGQDYNSPGGNAASVLADAPTQGGTPPDRFSDDKGFTRFYSPLGNQKAAVTSAYTGNNLRYVAGVYSGPKPHRGTDLDVLSGATKFPTYAIWDGEVLQLSSGGGGYRIVYELNTTTLQVNAPTLYNTLSSDYGFEQNVDKFKVKNGARIIVTYYHLEPGKGKRPAVAKGIKKGSKFTKGQLLAVADNTGGSSGAHLHININVVPNEGSWSKWVFGDDQARAKIQVDPMDWIYVRGVN